MSQFSETKGPRPESNKPRFHPFVIFAAVAVFFFAFGMLFQDNFGGFFKKAFASGTSFSVTEHLQMHHGHSTIHYAAHSHNALHAHVLELASHSRGW